VSIATDVLVFGFVVSLLRQRRPAGSAIAWLLAVVLIPYLGVPLYLVFGGRKLSRRASRKQRLGGLAGSKTLKGWASASLTSVHWLDEGVAAYEQFLAQILGAKRSIRIVTFLVGDDETGRSLVDALIRRARDGLEVRLLIDDLLRFHAPHGKLRELVAAGARVERFMPLVHVPFRGHGNLRNHRKIAIFDGERAIVGGMNLGTEYMGPTPDPQRWRDVSLLVEGQAVSELDTIVCADWLFACGESLSAAPSAAAGAIPVQVVPSGPDAESDPIYDADLTAIFRAEKRIWIATPYFVPDEALLRALVIAVRRGVDVRVVTPGRSNHLLSDMASGSSLRDLSAAGVTIRRFNKMLHAKTLLVDDSLAVVGSANFDMRSLFLNYEVSLFFSGHAEVERLNRWFEDTFVDTTLGPPRANALRSTLDDVARLIAPEL
jgi:cardiolipin synthase A/B